MILMGRLIFVWLVPLDFMNVGYGGYGSCLWLRRGMVLFRLPLNLTVQGVLQLLVFIHLHLKENQHNDRRTNKRKFWGNHESLKSLAYLNPSGHK